MGFYYLLLPVKLFNMKKYIETISENKCPKCDNFMYRRQHPTITDKILRQPYYFREWDFCKLCNHLQHYEHLKVFNERNEYNEYQKMESEQVNFLNSL